MFWMKSQYLSYYTRTKQITFTQCCFSGYQCLQWAQRKGCTNAVFIVLQQWQKWLHECCRSDIGSCWNTARELLQNSNMKLYGRLAAYRYNGQRNVEKRRQILYKRTNVRRNAEKIRQILYKRTNVRRNVKKTRLIVLYRQTEVRRNVEKIR